MASTLFRAIRSRITPVTSSSADTTRQPTPVIRVGTRDTHSVLTYSLTGMKISIRARIKESLIFSAWAGRGSGVGAGVCETMGHAC